MGISILQRVGRGFCWNRGRDSALPIQERKVETTAQANMTRLFAYRSGFNCTFGRKISEPALVCAFVLCTSRDELFVTFFKGDVDDC